MHKQVREFVEKAASIGWTCNGKLDGNGHYLLCHTNGSTYRIAATPSDWRGEKNALAELERLGGQKAQHVVRRRSRKPIALTGFDPVRAAREQRRWADKWGGDVDDLVAKRELLIDKMRDLSVDPSRQSAFEAASVLAEIREVEAQLTRFAHPHHPFDLTTLGPTERQTG